MNTIFDDFHSEDFSGFVDDSQYSNLFGIGKKAGKKLSNVGAAIGGGVGLFGLGKAIGKRKKKKAEEAQRQAESMQQSQSMQEDEAPSEPLVKDLKQAKVETAIIREQAKAVQAEAQARKAVAQADAAEASAEIAKTKTIQAKVEANETIAKSETNTTPLDVKGKIDDAPKTEVVVQQTTDDNTKKILAIAGIGLIAYLLWKNNAFSN